MSFTDIPVSHGRLEALLWKVPSPKAAVLVCHPHPLGGGTMHNHVTFRIADAFRKAGVTALRFNFRGVGRSSGAYDHGVGEVEDAQAGLNELAKQEPGVPLLAAGFSFGSRVALKLCAQEPRIERMLGVGLALDLMDFTFARDLRLPKAFIHADRDEYASLDKVRQFVDGLRDPKRLFPLQDSDHLATGRLDAFSTVAQEACNWLLAVPLAAAR